MSQDKQRPVGVGGEAPDFRLPAAQGGEVALSDYRGKQHVLLVFGGGMPCPFCRRHLSQLRLGYPDFQARGAEVLAVSPTPANRAATYQEMFRFPHPYLCDPEQQVVQRYGIPCGGLKDFAQVLVSFATSVELRAHRREAKEMPEVEEEQAKTQAKQLDGFHLVDREGIIRFSKNECSTSLIPSNPKIIELLETL